MKPPRKAFHSLGIGEWMYPAKPFHPIKSHHHSLLKDLLGYNPFRRYTNKLAGVNRVVTPKRRNPEQFTSDEIQTATLAYTEGAALCVRIRHYKYPRVRIALCVKKGLEPASRAFGRKITASRKRERIMCPPEEFPPDGRGIWTYDLYYNEIMKLSPLIPEQYLQKWRQKWAEKGCLRPIRPKKRRKPKT